MRRRSSTSRRTRSGISSIRSSTTRAGRTITRSTRPAPTSPIPARGRKPVELFAEHPDNVKEWIDFWVICDATRAHLFFTSLDGRMWRSETKRDDFPAKWSKPAVVLEGDIFEASHTYRLKGQDKIPDADRGPRRQGLRDLPPLLQGVPGRSARRRLEAAGREQGAAVRRPRQRAPRRRCLDRLVQPRRAAPHRPRREAGGGPGQAAFPVPGRQRRGPQGEEVRRDPLAAGHPRAACRRRCRSAAGQRLLHQAGRRQAAPAASRGRTAPRLREPRRASSSTGGSAARRSSPSC